MYVGYSNQTSTPQFDPLSPDVEMTDLAALADQISDQDNLDAIGSRQENSRSINQVRSINFSNVKIAPQFKGNGASKDRNNRGRGDDKVTKDRERFGADNPRGGSSRGGSNNSKGLKSILNPANFSANYSYNEQIRRDVYTDNFRNVEHRGGLNYSWQPKPKKREPFSKLVSCGIRTTSSSSGTSTFICFPSRFPRPTKCKGCTRSVRSGTTCPS